MDKKYKVRANKDLSVSSSNWTTGVVYHVVELEDGKRFKITSDTAPFTGPEELKMVFFASFTIIEGFSLTKKEEADVKEIRQLFNKIDILYRSLDEETKRFVAIKHIEAPSIDRCCRWGRMNTNYLLDKKI